jgi:hypothetical protein
MGLKRRKNTISLKEWKGEKNTSLWPEGSPPSPVLFRGASTSHAITISPVEQRNIVSKKKRKKEKKRYEGTQDTCPESPFPLLCLWGS